MKNNYKKIVYCIVLLLFFVLITYLIKIYLKPFLITLIIILLCTPIYNLLCRYKLLNHKFNAVISILIINALIVGMMFVIGKYLYIKIQGFNYGNLEFVMNKISSFTNVNLDELNLRIKTYYSSIVNSDLLTKGAAYTTEGLFAYFIGNIAAYFILIDKYVIFNWLKIFIDEDKIKKLVNKIEAINNIIKIEIILVFITTIETIFGFIVLNINDAFILGLVCGILDILPYIGTIFVFLPLIIYKISMRQYIIAGGLVLLYILLLVVRQVMEVKFIGNKLQLHPLLLIVSLYIGLKLFGIVGLLMGPLYIISVKEIIVNT